MTQTENDEQALREFRISVPQADIDSLRARLRDTRWPSPETVSDWSQGVPLAKAKALVERWAGDYDWRQFEAALNLHPQFLIEIDGLPIHFIHRKSPHPNALPLLITHGWPGTIAELSKVIWPLTHPENSGGSAGNAFDLVIPSLPGFGFSGKPTEPGWNVERIAKAWTVLMTTLGYKRWVAQGGDWGAVITTVLGKLKPEGLAGVHLNWQFVFPDPLPEHPSPEEKRAVDDLNVYTQDQGGYNHLQSTRPQTIGYSLADSPVGQATWILEKFQEWTDNQHSVEEVLSLNEILDVISLFWFTNSGASSARMYWENKAASFAGGIVDLPVAVTIFPKERPRLPESWIRKNYPNLIHFGRSASGGHFAAFEQPQSFVAELRQAFRPLR